MSTISRDAQKALLGTLVLIAIMTGGGPAVDASWAEYQKRAFDPVLSLTSPGYLAINAGRIPTESFWTSLVINQLLAFALFALGGALISRTWQERQRQTRKRRWERLWRFGSARSCLGLRRQMLQDSPVAWLLCRERWQSRLCWRLSVVMLGGCICMFYVYSGGSSSAWQAWSSYALLPTLALYLWIAAYATRFHVESRRSGFLELLLITPLTAREIVQGQWRGCVRLFALPVALFLAAGAVGEFMAQWEATKAQAAANAPAAPAIATATNATVTSTTGTTTTIVGGPSRTEAWTAWVMATTHAATGLTGLTALIWFGMWMGLRAKNGRRATIYNILFVQLIPMLLVMILAGLLFAFSFTPWIVAGSSTQRLMEWFPLIQTAIMASLFIGKDLFFFVWSRKQLHAHYRERAVGLL